MARDLPLYAISATSTSASTTAAARPEALDAQLNQTAEDTANKTAAASTVFGPPMKLRNGTNARHPVAAPSRSKKYTRSTRSMVSATTSETIVADRKNGRAVAK